MSVSEAAMVIAKPLPTTPTTALSKGRPAASRDPNVIRMTKNATISPMASVVFPAAALG